MKLEKVFELADKLPSSIGCLQITGEQLIAGTDDGFIKVWSTKTLKLEHEYKAHDYALSHILVLGDRLYSASMDQTVNVWQMGTWKLKTTLRGHEDTPTRIATDGNFIFTGDDRGMVMKWTKDGRFVSKYEILEEVWDLHVDGDRLFSVRDRGLTIWELKGESASSVVRSLEGRAPLAVTEEHLILLNQSGRDLLMFKNSAPNYSLEKEIKGHESIITVMGIWKDFIIAGGYDNKLSIWSSRSGNLEDSIALEDCPNAMRISDEGEVFLALENIIVKIKIAK